MIANGDRVRTTKEHGKTLGDGFTEGVVVKIDSDGVALVRLPDDQKYSIHEYWLEPAPKPD